MENTAVTIIFSSTVTIVYKCISVNYTLILQAPIDTQIPKLKDLCVIECGDYYDLGLQLDLREVTLETLRHEVSGDTRAFARRMFSLWLKGQGSKPTYKNLVLALRRIKENEEAKKLCDKFGE